MPTHLTIRDIVSRAELGLTVLAGADGLDARIEWVHYIDVVDLSLFHDDGALIMTQGTQLPPDAGERRAYIERLAEAGVIALAFGVGGSVHKEVPADLIDAAEERGFTLLRVPESTAFVEISRFVHQANVAAHYEKEMASLRAHKALTSAAVKADGQRSLVERLSQLIGGSVAIYDQNGEWVQGAPIGAPRYSVETSSQISRLRSGKLPAAISFESDNQQFMLQSIGTSQATFGFLLGAVPRSFSASDKQTLGIAASLLTVINGSRSSARDVAGFVSNAVWLLLRQGMGDAAQEIVNAMRMRLPAEPLEVAVLAGASVDRAAVAGELAQYEREESAALISESGEDRLLVLCTAGSTVAAKVRRLMGEMPGLTTGFSEPCTYLQLDIAERQAQAALRNAIHRKVSAERFGEIGSQGLADLLDRSRSFTWAQSRLAPLLEHDTANRGNLVKSLRAWLDHNGQWDPAASTLDVHRHTLRQRMTKVERLLDMSLDSMGNRAEMWMALTLFERDGTDDAG